MNTKTYHIIKNEWNFRIRFHWADISVSQSRPACVLQRDRDMIKFAWSAERQTRKGQQCCFKKNPPNSLCV